MLGFQRVLRGLVVLLLALFAIAGFVLDRAIDGEGAAPIGDRLSVNWYHGAENLRPVIEAFTAKTGIEVEVLDAYDLYNTDVLLISDFGTLLHAKRNGYLSRMRTPQRDALVPANYRDRDGMWYGVVLRARSVVYNRGAVDPAALTRWEDLADPRWEGRLCLRQSGNVYNRSLVSMMIRSWGVERTEAWIQGVVSNAVDGADHVYQGDTNNMIRVATGICDLTFMNTYYLGYAANSDEASRRDATSKVGVKWFDDDFDTPLNVTGVGINPGSKVRAEAEALVDYLLSEEGQSLLSEHVYKYPVRPDVEASAWLQTHGEFEPHEVDLNELEAYYAQAVRLMEANGWERVDRPNWVRRFAQERQRKVPFNPVLYPD